ncbi:MAG: phosphoribosylaminoimidazolesuccinocarboxamide synthase, partial [Desulfobacterales bacterium]|nr:phosphoribosylaminoimidazolesuccinocarboxamide synthase [Desulfobacterales bacterium]
MKDTVFRTDFKELKLYKKGKVRDMYDLGDALLMVASDRISAFDVVLPDPIPDKGKILTKISLFWFNVITPLLENHVISENIDDYPKACSPYKEILKDRSILIKKTDPIPIECVVRGYLSGSGWNSYLESRSICGIQLPEGMKESDRLKDPIFTPSTKEDLGQHDINIDFIETVKRVGKPTAEKIKNLSLHIYQKGCQLANEKGIIIADTKFEFGKIGNDVILIDEVLTPDSSRFWPKETYSPGGPQKSFDKQYVR